MVILRYMRIEDIEELLRWQQGNDEEALFQWAGEGYDYPLTHNQIEKRFINEKINQPESKSYIYMIELAATKRLIGQIELVISSKLDGVGSIGKFFIGNQQDRGKGYGKKTLELLAQKAFDDFGLTQLFLKVFDNNSSAIHCYERVGFHKVKFESNVYRAREGYWGRHYMRMMKP